MASVEIKNPQILTIEFRQDKDDEDYGECLWAIFTFDLTNYALSIKSDCGDYSYTWKPTPDLESFLQLCTRFADEYLLGKISTESSINNNKTWEKMQKAIEEAVTPGLEPDWDLDEIKNACLYATSAKFAHEDIYEAISYTNLEGFIGDEQIWDCVTTDFPVGAKKIVEIFQTHIVPVLKEKIKEQGETNE